MSDWRRTAIVYQVNLRALAAREPRNPIEAAGEPAGAESFGSPLAYAAAGLDAIAALGVNVLYFMPLFRMGEEARKGIGSPYAIRDFTALDPEFGTVAEFAGLVRGAHARGLRVLLDITPNHSSRDHVWTGRHPDYHVRDAAGRLVHDWDWSDTAKLNYRSPGLRHAMIEALDFWLCVAGDGPEAPDGVDGFRFDMAHIINDPSFWDEALATLQGRHPRRRLLFLAESYGFDANVGLFERGMHAAYDDDLYKIWQCLYAVDGAGRTVIAPDGEARRRADVAPLFQAYDAQGIAGAAERALSAYETRYGDSMPPWLLRYSDNHDEGRSVYRFGSGATRAINALVFLAPRTLPMLLGGQEFGAANRPPIHARLGLCDKGFRVAPDTGAAVHRVPGIELEGNVFARGRDERAAWYDFYRGLIRLRRRTPELAHGGFSPADAGEAVARAGDRTVIAFERPWNGSRVRCAVNLGPAPRSLEKAARWGGDVLWGTLREGVLDAFSAYAVRDAVGG